MTTTEPLTESDKRDIQIVDRLSTLSDRCVDRGAYDDARAVQRTIHLLLHPKERD